MERYPLSDFIDYQNDFITIEDAQEYKRVTAKLHRKGLVARDVVRGSEIKIKRQQVCKADQLLVAEIDAKVGGYGIVPRELEGSIVSSHYFLFTIRVSKLLPKYLEYVLKTDEFFSQINAQGSTNYAAIRPKDVLKIEIPCCNVELQKNIIEKLDSITTKSTHLSKNTLREKNHISRLQEEILHEAISGKLVPQYPNDEPASEILRKIKAEKEKFKIEKKIRKVTPLLPIKEEETPYSLPRGWEWVRLGEIIKICSGDGLTSAQMHREGDIPVFGGNGIIGYHDKYNVNKKTIVVGRVGFHCGGIHVTPEKAWVTDNAFITSFSEENIDMYFLRLLLKGTNLKEEESATAQPVISGRKIYPIVVGLPPLAEQKRIVSKVDRLMRLCDELEEKVKENQNNSELLMKAFLKEAFAS